MLVQEWSRNGRVVWCDASSLIKEQLNSVLQEPLYCDNSDLRVYLLGKFTYNKKYNFSIFLF